MRFAFRRAPSRLWAGIAIVTWLAVLAPRPGWAEAKIALLIGNRDYNEAVGRLENPLNDIHLVGEALTGIGFTVTTVENAGFRDLRRALGEHVARVRAAGTGTVAVFYYAGHGAANAVDKRNYLIPVDVETANDTSLWSESIDLQADVLDRLSQQAPEAVHYVVFDACRSELKLRIRGLRSIEPEEKGFNRSPDHGNVLVAFSTAPNRTASDGGAVVGRGPYARAFAEEVVKAGIEARTMFINTQTRVRQSAAQEPWLSMPPLPPVYLAGFGAASQPATPSPPISQAEAFGLERASVQRTIAPVFAELLADDGVPAGGAFNIASKWPTSALTICFLDGRSELNATVATVARQWTLYGKIGFDFGDWNDPRRCDAPGGISDVRVSYMQDGNWSYIGNQSQRVPPTVPTLNLASVRNAEAAAVAEGKHSQEILHEFGHVLGFMHNWAAPGADCDAEINWDQAYGVFAVMGWSRETVDANLRQSMTTSSTTAPLVGTFDRRSIMSYELPEKIFIGGRNSRCYSSPSSNLSLRDKLAVFKYY